MTIAERHQFDRSVASKPKAKPRKPFPAGKVLISPARPANPSR